MPADTEFRQPLLERLTEIGAALTDIAAGVEAGQATRDVLAELGSTLADMATRPATDGALTSALEQMRGSVAAVAGAVQAQETHARSMVDAIRTGLAGVELKLPARPGRTLSFDVEYHPNGQLRRLVMKELT